MLAPPVVILFLTVICLFNNHIETRTFGRSGLDLDDFDRENEVENDINRRMVERLMDQLAEGGKYSDPDEADKWMRAHNENLTLQNYNITLAAWDYATNITDYTAKYKDQIILYWSHQPWAQNAVDIARKFYSYRAAFSDKSLVRMLRMVARCGEKSHPNDAQTLEIATRLETIYGKGSVTDADGRVYHLEPELTEVMAQSPEHDDYDQLVWAWQGWRNVSGKLMKDDYEQLVKLENEAIKQEGTFDDMGDKWRACNFDEPDKNDMDTNDKNLLVKDMAEDLYQQIQPLYEELHAYVRYKLRGNNAYPQQKQVAGFENDDTAPIPAHILGNMWAQQWTISDLVKPFPEAQDINVTPKMNQLNWTPNRMFQEAERFFMSIGLLPMTETFWNKSMIVKPPDGRDVVCHASADDFSMNDDYRIKMCTTVRQEDLQTVHHEMGHIEYFMLYHHQPQLFREGANSAFHEAIGDTIALSVMTPGHLKKIGLLPQNEAPSSKWRGYEKRDINFLLKMALEKIAFLPFGYLIDKWRWDVYSGKITKNEFNRKWWYYRLKYQGVAPPVKRSEADFDPGAKYHVAAGVPYIRYFFSFIGQFQFHKALCEAKDNKPVTDLHNCDIYQSKAAGNKLRSMLELGSSRPWPEAMELMTGSAKFDASAISTYFRPLFDYLIEYRHRRGYKRGWSTDLRPFFET